jgi:hypothetical protein
VQHCREFTAEFCALLLTLAPESAYMKYTMPGLSKPFFAFGRCAPSPSGSPGRFLGAKLARIFGA